MASAPLGRLLCYLEKYFGRILFVARQQPLGGISGLLGVQINVHEQWCPLNLPKLYKFLAGRVNRLGMHTVRIRTPSDRKVVDGEPSVSKEFFNNTGKKLVPIFQIPLLPVPEPDGRRRGCSSHRFVSG